MTGALEQFNRSDAVLDAIDTSGLRADGDLSGSGTLGSGTDALYTMATTTNGDLIRNSNQLEGELGKLEERTSLVYLLLYQPKALSRPGAFHALKVKVKTPGARVLARSGYYEPRPYQSLSPLERVLAAGDLITGGTRANEVQASLLAAPFASQTDLAQVPVLIEIPGKGLLAGDSGGQASVQIYVYANDAKGTLTDYMTSEMTLDLSKVGPALEAGGLKFYGTLYLPVGSMAVQALVRNGTTGRAGVFSTRVEVPEIPGGAPTVLPPFFEEAPGRWLMVRGNPREDAPPRPADYPFVVAGESFVPAASAVVNPGAPARVAVVAYNFGVSAKPEPLEVRAEVVGADGKSRPADVTVVRRSDVERGGGRKVVLDFKPQGLAAGRYALKVALTDPASKKTAGASSPFEVPYELRTAGDDALGRRDPLERLGHRSRHPGEGGHGRHVAVEGLRLDLVESVVGRVVEVEVARHVLPDREERHPGRAQRRDVHAAVAVARKRAGADAGEQTPDRPEGRLGGGTGEPGEPRGPPGPAVRLEGRGMAGELRGVRLRVGLSSRPAVLLVGEENDADRARGAARELADQAGRLDDDARIPRRRRSLRSRGPRSPDALRAGRSRRPSRRPGPHR